MVKKKIVIVSGITGDLGRAYGQAYSQDEGTQCYGLTRRDVEAPLDKVRYLRTDLLNAQTTQEQINRIDFTGVKDIILLHPVGMFKYEKNGKPEKDFDGDGIDDEVYASNLQTFRNVITPLLDLKERKEGVSLLFAAFGSLSDPYHVPLWHSYSQAKLLLREEMKELAYLEDEVNCAFFNLSSVLTKNECTTRPYADTTYWSSPEYIVRKTVPLLEHRVATYIEENIFVKWPGFHKGYYKDFEALERKWKREMEGA